MSAQNELTQTNLTTDEFESLQGNPERGSIFAVIFVLAITLAIGAAIYFRHHGA